ncbi:MAG: universal stress protein [Peptococcaceae bacterium]|nr:universal stress protein [Peptococcaceae bacterium]
MSGYEHILIPVDGSECSERALAEGKRMQAAFGAQVTLLFVVSDPDFDCTMGNPSLGVASMEHDVAEAETYLARCAESFEKDCETKVVVGCIAKSILAEAKALGCDLIVMGSQGLGSALRRFLVGSVAKNVLSSAEVPVLIVH